MTTQSMTSTRPAPAAPEPPDQDPGYSSIRTEAPTPLGSFLFEQRQKRISGALVVSIALHALGLLFVVYMITMAPVRTFTPPEQMHLPDNIVWLQQAGPGGGGGGGGNKSPEPPRKVEMPGKDRLTVPVSKPPSLEVPKEVKPTPQEPPKQELTIPAVETTSGVQNLPGTLVGQQSLSLSQGSGEGGGAGTGRGTGIGPGQGPGLGPGSGGGSGGGIYELGSGVTDPIKLYEQRPSYTPDAMRARIQGSVVVSAVVLPDGTVGDPKVLRSLDSVFGLDQEAIKAVRLWRFKPGLRQGQPVSVRVSIEVTFTLR
jgi:TonB family protein